MLSTMFQDLLTVIQVFAIFWQYLSSTGDDINYWVYVLTLEVNTGVCNLTRQGRLQKTTTTRNSTVCLCIFFTFRIFHIPHFTLRSAVLFRKPNSAFYTFAIFRIPQSAFRILPVPSESLELSYIRHRSNNHEASASTLRSDSVATLDSGHVHFILFRLPDGPAASASSHKQQHQVRLLIDAIISLTASQASSEKYCLTSSTAARSSHPCIVMPSFKSDTWRTSPSRIARLKAAWF